MTEFKFYCPQCGKQIQCGTSYSGTQINCPVCQQPITVPQPPRAGAAIFQPVVPAKSRLGRNVLFVVAALIVLAGLVVVGWFGYAHHNARHALKFNLGNRVEIPNDRALQFGNSPFTISLWFKTASQRQYFMFISKRVNSLGDGWVLGSSDDQKLGFYCAGCASPKSQPVSIRDNKWHQVLITRSNGQMTFYLDGKNVGSGQDECNHYDNNPIRIGMDGDGNSWHFEGEISEVHLYRRALSQDAVAEEWNNGKGLVGPVAGGGLIAGYHFDEGDGTTAKDFSGNNHDGRLISNPEWEN